MLAKKTSQYDDMGQPHGTPKGEPDAAAVEALENAQEASTLKPLIDVAPAPRKKASGAKARAVGEEFHPNDPAFKEAVRQAIKEDPSIARAVADVFGQDPHLREMLNIPAGAVAPSGEHKRDYQSEPALRVYGGVEVEHGPEVVANPPSYITKFLAADEEGGKTDNLELAQLDADGKPVKTEEYKYFLDMRAAGKRIDGNVRFDIAADSFTVGDAGINV